jgi:glycosyltransferase involved in cell wall biosynthesis
MAENIVWHRLDLGEPDRKANIGLMLRRANAVRTIMKRRRPQSVTCFQDGPFVALRLYALGLGIPFIAAERSAPTRFDHTRSGKRKGLIYQSFRMAGRIVIQCESYRSLYPSFLRKRIITIPNPVFATNLRARPDSAGAAGRFTLISIGRLGYQKNYAALIEAFARLAPVFPDWDLTIVGDGEDRESLKTRIASHGLCDRAFLPGTSKAVEESYARAHCFVLPSRWEGFPNALAEAMAHGLPSVGYAGCAGVSDLIAEGRTGLLAGNNGDATSLADALAVVMSDPPLRARMGDAAINRVSEFAPERVFDRWEQVLSEVARP